MHNPSTPPPPPPPPPPQSFNMDSIGDPSTSIWDWSEFLDFNIDDHLPLPNDNSPIIPSQELYPIHDVNPHQGNSISNTNDRVRKRDPRMACSNFLAGRIPCACPELDAQLAAEEEEAAAPGKKKTRTITPRTVANSRCQVPGCEVDISELKGYHKRHRVCLRCATATTVVLDGLNKRYCQQCGKFHVLPDFDEGKRSCRRKLERHNNRRRRKPSDSKTGLQSAADYEDGYDEKGAKSTSSEVAGDKLLSAAEGHNSLPSSTHAQNIQSDSIPSLAVSGETQSDEDKEKGTHSPSYCDDKSAFSSMCPTGRISFKLYDWNPAEFPRRLRHQIFQWLASMPVELEGYIRPGCTILTIFIAMPRFMWVKLGEDPVVCIHDLLASPRNLLSGRDTFFVSLNSTIFSVLKGGRSVIKIKAGENSPKLHYVQPTCFVAGKPIEFLACGSDLLQPRLRFLVSFSGKYMANDVRVSPLCNQSEASTTNSVHQFLNIRIPHTELDVFGPGFIEVENESGLSNFIPILLADEQVCYEIKIMQMKYYSTLHSRRDPETNSCEVAVNKFSELLLDMAWLLKQPIVQDMECDMMSSQLQRFTFLLNFLIEYESIIVLKRVLDIVKMRIIKIGDMVEVDRTLIQETMNHASKVLNQRLEKKVNIEGRLHLTEILPEDEEETYKDPMLPFISAVNQNMQISENVGLLTADCVMSVTPYKEQPEKPSNRMFTYYNTNRLFRPRPLILAVALVTVCFGICAVVFHPQKATAIVITIRSFRRNNNTVEKRLTEGETSSSTTGKNIRSGVSSVRTRRSVNKHGNNSSPNPSTRLTPDNVDAIANVLLALERIDQEEGLTYEQIQILRISFLGGYNLYDQHRDMRLDIDNMSYEEEFIGGDEIGRVGCDHGYNAVSINQWLRLKNWCPICKASGKPSHS